MTQGSPWRGFTIRRPPPAEDDAEKDDCDCEPSLGSRTSSEHSNQETWGNQPAETRAAAGVDLEDEHDGAEPENEHGDGNPDDEPSLGWTVDGCVQNTGEARCDAELQDHATVLPSAPRTAKGVTVEDRFCGRKTIRNLSDGQREAVKARMSRYGAISSDIGGAISVD